MMIPLVFSGLAMAVLFACLPSNAHAYLDPGTGSMIFQAVLAAIAAASVSIGIFWRRIKAFFTRRPDSGEKGNDDA
jgi:hypothetical protein